MFIPQAFASISVLNLWVFFHKMHKSVSTAEENIYILSSTTCQHAQEKNIIKQIYWQKNPKQPKRWLAWNRFVLQANKRCALQNIETYYCIRDNICAGSHTCLPVCGWTYVCAVTMTR